MKKLALMLLMIITVTNAITVTNTCGTTNLEIHNIEVLGNEYVKYSITQETEFDLYYNQPPESIEKSFELPVFSEVLDEDIKCFDDRGEDYPYKASKINESRDKTYNITIECEFGRSPLSGPEKRKITTSMIIKNFYVSVDSFWYPYEVNGLYSFGINGTASNTKSIYLSFPNDYELLTVSEMDTPPIINFSDNTVRTGKEKMSYNFGSPLTDEQKKEYQIINIGVADNILVTFGLYDANTILIRGWGPPLISLIMIILLQWFKIDSKNIITLLAGSGIIFSSFWIGELSPPLMHNFINIYVIGKGALVITNIYLIYKLKNSKQHNEVSEGNAYA